LEGHAIQYTIISQLDSAYKTALANHFFDRAPIDQGIFDFISQRYDRQIVKARSCTTSAWAWTYGGQTRQCG
jgi:hypothetical protein